MANLAQARRSLRIVLVVCAILVVAALAVLISPLARPSNSGQKEFDDVRAKVQQKIKQVIPPDQVDTRVSQARTQIDQFYKDRLPAEASTISVELGKLAAESGVHLSTAHYGAEDTDVPDLEQVKITANLSGDYLQIVKFINLLERDRLFFIVDNVSLVERGSGGLVGLQVVVETYLRKQA
ncbi:MAG TPA: GspMb/PilO family protein [Terriglobales bacterium]|nr:GspMb/PilO family protein [Terriglobales bacterium]